MRWVVCVQNRCKEDAVGRISVGTRVIISIWFGPFSDVYIFAFVYLYNYIIIKYVHGTVKAVNVFDVYAARLLS